MGAYWNLKVKQSSMGPRKTEFNRTAFPNGLISKRNPVVCGAGSRTSADPEDRQRHM